MSWFKSGAKWLISPRVFMSAEDCSKYGALSLTPIKRLFSEIAEVFSGLNKKAESVEIDITNKAERAEYFYDQVFTNAIFGQSLARLHRRYFLAFKYSMLLSLLLTVFSVVLTALPRFTILPNWIVSVVMLIVCFTVFVRGMTMAYFAWLIQQRLSTELFSFGEYISVTQFFKRLPNSTLNANQLKEIPIEERKRVDLIKQKLRANPALSLSDFGLVLPPGVALERRDFAPGENRQAPIDGSLTTVATAASAQAGGLSSAPAMSEVTGE